MSCQFVYRSYKIITTGSREKLLCLVTLDKKITKTIKPPFIHHTDISYVCVRVCVFMHTHIYLCMRVYVYVYILGDIFSNPGYRRFVWVLHFCVLTFH